MIALLPASLLEWGRVAVVAVLVALVTFPLGQCSGAKSERKAWQLEVANQKAKAEQMQRRADELLRANQALQQQQIASDRKEVDNAVSQIPDSAPTARQRTRACIQLRRQAAAARQPEPAC